LVSYLYDHLAANRAARRKREALLVRLAKLPAANPDFSTP
jgi:hypothetical protein